MRYLHGREYEQAERWLNYAAGLAYNSKCLKHRCGSVIVSSTGIVMGEGYNAPPLDKIVLECINEKLPKEFKGERHCCIHAEQRAIMDGLIRTGGILDGSSLYFTRIDENGKILFSGKPYCTICSKMSLDAKISKFVLWHKEGICEYDTDEYNRLSFAYKQ